VPAVPAPDQQPFGGLAGLHFERDFDLEALHFEAERPLLRLPLPHFGGVGLQLERPLPPAP
jgi:hypothetical protein